MDDAVKGEVNQGLPADLALGLVVTGGVLRLPVTTLQVFVNISPTAAHGWKFVGGTEEAEVGGVEGGP